MKTKETPRQNSGQAKIQKKWTVMPEAPAEVFELAKDYPKPIVQILYNRGIFDLHLQGAGEKTPWRCKEIIENFLNPDYKASLHDPFLLKDMDKAVERILKAVKDKEKICVYGDYDVDGVTSTAIVSIVLDKLGVDFLSYIPSRHSEGYGMNQEAIDELGEKRIKLIITVDCGVRSFDEVEYAKGKGIDVIVTDHHDLSKQEEDLLPQAVAVINPKRLDCDYPFKELAGAGVAFKLACALLVKGENLGEFSKGWEKWLLDLVALGTVCDVVPLQGENRVLVKYGLKVIEKTKRAGLKALINSAGITGKNISAHNLGFHLGPRLNASGRMEHANLSLELLLTEDTVDAERMATNLSKLNKERQDITSRILGEVEALLKDQLDKKVHLLRSKDWPSGIVGIVASRLVESCGRPVLLMEEGESESKGSARSIDGFDITKALEGCKDILVKFGGHKRAAGFTVKNEHFLLLEEKLLEIADGVIKETDLISEIQVDLEISPEKLDSKFRETLLLMEPFGHGNEKPIFLMKNVEAINPTLVGQEKNHLKLKIGDKDSVISGIAFNFSESIKNGQKIDVVCFLNENEWNGKVNLEARILDIKQ